MEELSALLSTLEEIGNSDEELYDTDVKEKMNEVIVEIFINENPDFIIPKSFSMFSELSDKKIQNAFKTFRSCLNTKNLDHKEKFILLGANGAATKKGQISECFFGEITEDSLSLKVRESSYSWLKNDWVYYLFMITPAVLLFSLTYYLGSNRLNRYWYILIIFLIIVVSLIIGDKFWQFCANNSFRKNENT